MRRLLLLLAICLLGYARGYAQFSATLAGYPLSTAGWTVGGTGTVVDSTIRLTSPTTNQSGYVYYSTPVNLTGCAQFTVKFDFKVQVSAASSVADGIAFWYISNPPSGFTAGGGIGLPSNPNGLILILDTYDNTAPVNVPLETLLGYDGTIPGYTEGAATGVLAPVVPSQFFITDGAWHHCELVYNAGNVFVYFNYSATPSLTGYYPMSITGYFGFSASTGAAYSTQSVKNIHIESAGVAPPPTVTSPVTYCQGATAVPLTATGLPGSTIKWFTTDTATVVSLPGAPTPSTATPGTTTYYVRQGSGPCISAPDSIKVIVNPSPAAPDITGTTLYCAGDAAVPFTVTGATGTVKWYTVPTGGVGTSTPILATTSPAGNYSYYVSQTVAGCEGPRDSIKVHVKPTPPAPTVTGPTSYCINVGPFVPLNTLTTATGSALWYTSSTGGTGTSTPPTVNITIAGTYNFWVSQVDSACEGPRAPVTIVVHAKPAAPTVTPPSYCQFASSSPLTATGASLTWYGPGVTLGMSTAPTPPTATAGTVTYYVTQTSSFGCISDSAIDVVTIKPKPAPPVTEDTFFCQNVVAPALTAVGSNLKWYTTSLGGVALGSAPVPNTVNTGTNTWYTSQTVNGCESDRAPVSVEILYLPQFTITPSQSWVCEHDSLTFNYTGSGIDLVAPIFAWHLPPGASLANGTHGNDSDVVVKFDVAGNNLVVELGASDYGGKCASKATVKIDVAPQPFAMPFSNHELCFGDTVGLSLMSISDNAYKFTWYIDNVLLASSPAVDIVSHGPTFSNGGPFMLSWLDTGIHIISLQTVSKEGCKSEVVYDSVNVHNAPDASFIIKEVPANLCLRDSVQLAAKYIDYANSYLWEPSYSFASVHDPIVWGRIESVKENVSLTVIDPFGCRATTSTIIDPDACCKLDFPTAFTPNGDSRNDVFRPLTSGFKRFHSFRVVNRWGQVVFEAGNTVPQWDGNYNGVPQDMGVYYYFAQYDCGGNTIDQKGDVTLVR